MQKDDECLDRPATASISAAGSNRLWDGLIVVVVLAVARVAAEAVCVFVTGEVPVTEGVSSLFVVGACVVMRLWRAVDVAGVAVAVAVAVTGGCGCGCGCGYSCGAGVAMATALAAAQEWPWVFCACGILHS